MPTRSSSLGHNVMTGANREIGSQYDNVKKVADDIESVVAVADNLEDVHTVAGEIEAVVTTAQNVESVATVAAMSSDIEVVVANAGDITTVATNIDDVVAVAAIAEDIPTVVAEIVPNMAEILMADTNAAIATAKANAASGSALEAEASAEAADISEQLAYEWANKAEDVPVTGVIGVDDEYSAYHWAKKAEAAAGGNITVDALFDVDTTGVSNKQVLRYDATGDADKKWIPSTVDKTYVGLENVDNTADVDKIVASASKLTTARTITVNGDVSGTTSFDGSSNVTVAATLASVGTAGTYTKVTTDAKGRVTAGSNPTTLSGYGITDAYTKTQVDTALDAKVDESREGVANGIATLDSNSKVPLAQIPDSVLGQLEYMGVWNMATYPTATQKGQYWVASGAGNGYAVGDWAVWNGSSFDKVDNTDAVSSVAGRTGAVVLTKADVGLSNVDNTSDATKVVASAGKWTTARTVTLAGDVTGSASVDGSSDVTVTTVVADNSHSHSNSTITDVDWSKVANKPDPVVTVTLTGDVTGTANTTLTDLGNGTVSVATTIAANSVALGTDTTGNYVAGVTAGSGITVTGTAGEGWSPTIAHADTSSATSVASDNSNGTVIQDVTITVDTYGHVTAASVGTVDLDSRYYTETEVQNTLPKVGFNTANVTAPSAGQMAWNQDERTVDLGLNGVTLQLGQEILYYVRNNTASIIANKTVVMATGTIGNSGRITVAPYNLGDPKYLLGVATEDIAVGADGYITWFGKVREIDTSMWVDGDVLYVAASGGLTNVVPTGVKLPIAFVVHAHTNGTLFVRVTTVDENAAIDCGTIA